MVRPVEAAVAPRLSGHACAWAVLLWPLLSVCIGGTAAAEQVSLRQIGFADIQEWTQDRHIAALEAFARTCPRLSKNSKPVRIAGRPVASRTMKQVCRAAVRLGGTQDNQAARQFFESHFDPVAVIADGSAQGLFTGYFEPEYDGSLQPSGKYRVPLYKRPAELVRFHGGSGTGPAYGRKVGGKARPYFSRREIESGALRGRGLELVYLSSPVDAFFIHVQGSGRVRLPDGGVIRVGFAAKSGHPYTAVGKVLIDMGVLRREDVSMQSIRAWLEANPDKAQAVIWRNQSFIFFRRLAGGDPDLGPPGAAGVSLTPGRSLAVDPRHYSYGVPLWLETTLPIDDSGETVPYRRLMVAQDTGSAIKGAIRGDVFVGTGSDAGAVAGRMKQKGRLVALVPRKRRASVRQSGGR
ncbi:MAG: murein transglycosylase A [Hyphomicrobiales bacterium]